MGLIAESQGLPAMGVLYCLGAGWLQWRPLDIPGIYLPYSLMQLLTEYCQKSSGIPLVLFYYYFLVEVFFFLQALLTLLHNASCGNRRLIATFEMIPYKPFIFISLIIQQLLNIL